MKQGKPLSAEMKGVNLEPILEELGDGGRYQIIQLILNILASFAIASPTMEIVFIGYQPDYQCRQVENVTELQAYLPDDVSSFTLHDVSYQQCSIDVTVNGSTTSSTHSLPCVAGVNFSMPSDTSFLTEWSLVCDKAGLSQLTQTGFFGGQIAGNFLFAILADRYGRKKVYVVSAFFMAFTLIARALVPTYDMFLACRTLSGFFLSGVIVPAYTMFMELLPQKSRCMDIVMDSGVIVPAYTMFMELLPQQSRCMGSVMDSIMWALGCLLLALVAYCLQGFSWRYLSLALACVLLYSLLLPWFLDESLRWLLATGEIKEAERLLKKACRMNGKDFSKVQAMLHKQAFTNNTSNSRENNPNRTDSAANRDEGKNNSEIAIEEMNTEEKTYEEKLPQESTTAEDGCRTEGRVAEAASIKGDHPCGGSVGENKDLKPQSEVFSAKYSVLDLVRYRVVFVPFLVTTFVWVSNSLYYYTALLGSSKLIGNRFLNFGLLNLESIPSTFVALFLVRRFNRRPLAFVYGIMAGTFLLISVGLVAWGSGEGLTMTLATVVQYLGLFCLTGSYIVLFVHYMEVYPTALRAVGTGTSATVNRTIIMGAPFLLLWAEKNPWAPGVLLGCLRCLSSFCIWLLPETRHRMFPDTIEEIQAW